MSSAENKRYENNANAKNIFKIKIDRRIISKILSTIINKNIVFSFII